MKDLGRHEAIHLAESGAEMAASPLCYESDVTELMTDDYRRRHRRRCDGTTACRYI